MDLYFMKDITIKPEFNYIFFLMATFQDYLEKIMDVKFSEISASYKTQFKLKETMLNASSRSFESIVSK